MGSSSIMDCKLCNKRFSNGKALGPHMRSHYAILPLPPKDLTSISDDRESSSSGDKSILSAAYALREKPKKSSLLPDPEFFDVESEPATSRFKRARGINLEMEEKEMEEQDVALCLIMLSRDVWSKKIHRCEDCQKVFKSSQGLGSHKASHFKKMRNSFQERELVGDQVHECALCPRIFKSAQALGGHKRSHFPVPKFGGNLVDLNLPAAVGVVNEQILA